MIFKRLVQAVVFASIMLGTASAEDLSSALVVTYYQSHIQNRPTGVYEWPSAGLLFVQVRTPYSGSETPEELECDGLNVAHQELVRWLLRKSNKKETDPKLAYGLDCARQTIRRLCPEWEFSSGWRFRGKCQSFSRMEKKERVFSIACKRSDVEASLPKSFYKPAAESVWLKGIRAIVDEYYVSRFDSVFVWQIGALDALDVSRKSMLSFPSLESLTFAQELGKGLEDANATWQNVNSPAHDEYVEVRKMLKDYLMSSPLSVRLYQAALKIAHSTAPLEWSNVSQPSESTMQTDVSTVTNTLKLACPVTNVVVTTVAKCGAELMTWRDQVTVRKCQTDEEVVTTVETQTVVRVVKTIRRKTMVTRSGEPRFEKLFLGGGCLANEEEPRTGRGLEAERKFFGTCAMQDREAAVMTALRENPGDKEAWNLLGKMLQKREDWLGAIVCFRNALRLDRTHEYALLNLAETYASLGKRRLSVACAFLAYGIAKNPRCVTGAEQLLKREW